MDEQLRTAPIGVIETTTAGTVLAANDRAAALLETSRSALEGADIREQFPQSAARTLRTAFENEPAAQSFEEYYPGIERWLAVDVHVGDDVTVYLRDRTEHREAEATVERLEQRLARSREIDDLIVTVLRSVIDAEDRSEVAETVCRRLGSTALYDFVWVGDREFEQDDLRLLATAGDDDGFCDRLADTLDGESRLPGATAVRTGETQLVDAIAKDESIAQPIRQAAFGRGLRSCLAVPLVYQDAVYGVVSVYSAREEGFSEQERAGLETLGSVAGFAVNAVRQESLLLADTVTEVTIEVRDETVPLIRAARETDQALSLQGMVPRGDGVVVCYLGGFDPEAGVESVLADHEQVIDVRRIGDDGQPLLEVTLGNETPLSTMLAWGATIRDVSHDGESARYVAEAPPDEEVRRMVETVDATVEQTDLLARTDTTRSPASAEAFRDRLDDRLTDRQRIVLQTAFLADYFNSPRGSTSEEVAEALDIAGPTVLYHLRRAQRKLVESFFADDPSIDTGQ